MQVTDWHEPGNFCVGMLLSEIHAAGAASPTPAVFIIFNAATASLQFRLPQNRCVRQWRCILSTVADDNTDVVADTMVVEARSVYLLLAAPIT